MTTKRKQMKNFIIDHKDKIELIQHIVEEFTDTCKGLPIYTALDNGFAVEQTYYIPFVAERGKTYRDICQ